MISKLLLVTIFIFCWKRGAGEIKCDIRQINRKYDYSCPLNSKQKMVIHVHPRKSIRMICINIDAVNHTILPDINFSDKYLALYTQNCPTPRNGFQVLLKSFHIKKLKFLYHIMYPNRDFQMQNFEGLQSIVLLDLSHNNITYFDHNIFKITPQLSVLDLSNNNLLLYDDIFKNALSLTELDLYNNNISYLPGRVFNGLNYLRRLNMTSNRIEFIEGKLFRDLINLESVGLGFNLLNRIDSNAFENLRIIRSINLHSNKLAFIPEKIFENCTLLNDVILSENNELALGNHFSNLLYLHKLNLRNNHMKMLFPDLLVDCPTLKILNLQHNKLEYLPRNIFNNQVVLRELYLNNNEIKILDNDVFRYLRSLQYLSLQYNLLTNISADLLRDLPYLEKLDLSFNKIHTFHSDIFRAKYKLINFWINDNELNVTHFLPNDLIDCRNIELLDFSNNKISQFPYQLMEILIKMEEYTIITKRRPVEFLTKMIVDLQKNDISQIIYNTSSDSRTNSHPARIHAKISENPINCDCQALDLITKGRRMNDYISLDYDNLVCAGPRSLANTSIEHVDANKLICTLERNCTQNYDCGCSYKSATETIIVDCSNRNLTEYPQLVLGDLPEYFHFVRLNRAELHVEDNLFEEGPTENEGYNNISELYLQRNALKSISFLPPYIEVLYLQDNNLESLDIHILNSLNDSSIKELSLGNNPWKCDCTTRDFINYLWIHKLKIIDGAYVKCNTTDKELLNLGEDEFCTVEREIFPIILSTTIICLSILVISAIILSYYLYQEEILIWLYARNTCLWLVKEERIDRNKIYDAFISFAHQDEELVMEHLVPNLEQGTPAFKLCVHVRDWVPGEYIASQISNSVSDSRRTLIILSKHFLKSVWGKMEFRTAHTTAMEEGRMRLIIVIYGDIEMDQLEDELKAYLSTNTYIKWGDPWFWEKLRYALPRSRNRHRKPNVRQPTYTATNNIELQEWK